MENQEAQKLIKKLGLQAHPEGGFFRETYRSDLNLDSIENFDGPRSCSTGIYFMLTSSHRSHLHRIKSDEMWHFYSGSPLTIHMLDETGTHSQVNIGRNLANGERFQFVVPAGVWFGAEVKSEGDYALVGCTVAPGFDFNDFELANKKEMLQRYPEHTYFLELFCINEMSN